MKLGHLPPWRPHPSPSVSPTLKAGGEQSAGCIWDSGMLSVPLVLQRAGVGWEGRLLPSRVMDVVGSGTGQGRAEAPTWSAEHLPTLLHGCPSRPGASSAARHLRGPREVPAISGGSGVEGWARPAPRAQKQVLGFGTASGEGGASLTLQEGPANTRTSPVTRRRLCRGGCWPITPSAGTGFATCPRGDRSPP